MQNHLQFHKSDPKPPLKVIFVLSVACQVNYLFFFPQPFIKEKCDRKRFDKLSISHIQNEFIYSCGSSKCGIKRLTASDRPQTINYNTPNPVYVQRLSKSNLTVTDGCNTDAPTQGLQFMVNITLSTRAYIYSETQGQLDGTGRQNQEANSAFEGRHAGVLAETLAELALLQVSPPQTIVPVIP